MWSDEGRNVEKRACSVHTRHSQWGLPCISRTSRGEVHCDRTASAESVGAHGECIAGDKRDPRHVKFQVNAIIGTAVKLSFRAGSCVQISLPIFLVAISTVMTLPSLFKYTEERSFGFLFAAIFMLAAGHFGSGRMNFILTISLLGIGCGVFACAIFKPHLLSGLNRGWRKTGQVLGKVMSPVILGLIYFGLITPIALVMRAAGRDALKVHDRTPMTSYWIARDIADRDSSSLKNQF